MIVHHIDMENWLMPLGYTEIYSNHPTSEVREFHFIKDGIRVVCVEGSSSYTYLHTDVMYEKFPLSIKTTKFNIGDTTMLTSISDHLKDKLKLLR